jgi:hypothetical protein
VLAHPEIRIPIMSKKLIVFVGGVISMKANPLFLIKVTPTKSQSQFYFTLLAQVFPQIKGKIRSPRC